MPLFFTDNFPKFKKHNSCSLLFILSLLSISVFIINPSFAAVNSAKELVVTITAKNEPLKMVLEKISRATGHKIEVTEDWENKPATVEIQGLTLDDSLNKIIRALGNPNNAKIDYENKKVIRINFFDTSKDSSLAQNNNDFNQLPAKQAEAVLNMDNIPPIGDKKIAKDSASKIDPLDMEVLPPKNSGEKGKTLRELKISESDRKQVDPLDMEILPPKNLGEKGKTLRELKISESDRKQIDPLDMEILPPKNPGEKGKTLRELKKSESDRKQIDHLDRE